MTAMTAFGKRFRKRVAAMVACAVALSPLSAGHAAVSQQPLIFSTSVAPNVMFTLDDSGSMMFEITPESLSPNGTESNWDLTPSGGNWLIYAFPLPSGGRVYSNDSDDDYYSGANASVVNFSSNSLAAARYRTAALNVSYYNPDVTYRPWFDPASKLVNANPKQAYYNPMLTGRGSIDLTADKTVEAYWLSNDGRSFSRKTVTFYPALYYRYDPALSNCNKTTSDLDCFKRYEIKTDLTFPHNGKRSDCAAPTSCTYAEEIQNFANWFQYYRSRILAMRAAVGQAFSGQNEAIRVGFTTINDKTRSGTSSYAGIRRPVVPFDTTTNKPAFYQDFYSLNIAANGTPLLGGMEAVGKYFQNNAQPWTEPGGTKESACRASYHILSTDGYYTDSSSVGDVDSSKGPRISPVSGTAYQYQPVTPYKDSYSNTLADVAMKYWVNDLRTTENRVPTNARDEAFWQHLVTFTLGLGVKGSLESDPNNQPGNPNASRDDVLDAILAKLKAGTISWPRPSSDQSKIDDLWHAAVNTRADNYSAGDASGLAAALNNALTQISSRSGSSSSAATNATTLNTDTALFLTRFRSGAWTGELQSRSFNAADRTFSIQNWNAYQQMPAAASRKIYTWSPGTAPAGKPFRWSSDSDTSLSSAQKAALGGDKTIVAYLRGDTSLEKRNGGKYRDRVTDNGAGTSVSNVLGDIVNSSPIYVKAADAGYDYLNADGGNSYFGFLANNRNNRRAMIYVGANDGMLHGFDALTGEEKFAYVPNQAIVGANSVKALASPDYIHRFLVDATPSAGDAYIRRGSESTASWRTVLVGGMGAGGKGMFALDVTDPSAFDEKKVMWEIAADNDNDLGYTFGTPVIGRVNSGKWVAIFGNGYESGTGKAVLYIVDLANPFAGNGIQKIYADAKETAVTGNNNGLGSPEVVYDDNLTIQAVYAGDLKGRLWKFDLSGDNPAAWSARMGTTRGAPLFTAQSAAGTAQPITAAPTALVNPKDPKKGFLLTFGTGRFHDAADTAATGYNSVYGVWDNNAAAATRSDLRAQTLALGSTIVDGVSRPVLTLSSNAVDYTTRRGWYIDLLTQGERVVVKPKTDAERLVVTTLTPSTDECVGGISSNLLDFAALTGAALPYAVLDVNGDGKVDGDDNIKVNDKVLVVSGIAQQGNFGSTIFTGGSGGSDHLKVASATTGDVISVVEKGNIARNRLSWRQISQ